MVHLVGSYSTEVNADKTKCMFISRAQNARQSYNAEIARKSFETGKLPMFGRDTNR
jgi:hypothetical protein